jgi:hypothetical protein
MFRVLTLIFAMLIGGVAYAQDADTGRGSLNTNSNNENSNNDSSQSTYYHNSTSISNPNVPSVNIPTVYRGNQSDSCLGSAQGGANTGAFSFSLGSTTRDLNCERIKNVRLLISIGLKDAAVALLMQDSAFASAISTAYPELGKRFDQNKGDSNVKANNSSSFDDDCDDEYDFDCDGF